MPYRTVKVRAPLFMRHKGVRVYHVFKHDDADAGDLRTYAYTFDLIEGSDDDQDGVVTFDVRELSTFDKGAPHDEKHVKAAIRAALDKGEIAPPDATGRGKRDRQDGVVTFDVRALSAFDKDAPHDVRRIKAAIRAALDKGEVGPAQKEDGR